VPVVLISMRRLGCDMLQQKRRHLPLMFAIVVLAMGPLVSIACQRESRDVAECEAAWSSAHGQVAKVIAEHRSCGRDEDCALVADANGCLSSCDTAIHRSGVAAYDATKARVSDTECVTWRTRACNRLTPKAQPSCPMLTARCRDSRCTAVNERQ
jgi:hypothetical protein